ncbi:MAG: hypothetical protein IJ058_12080 [Lachnospiraceae bacterium]|nr:hypothetical protein [Lachnospiraceae bacterium]
MDIREAIKNRHSVRQYKSVPISASDMPEWVKTGVEAALLAPTAINQQKFVIDLQGEVARISSKKAHLAMWIWASYPIPLKLLQDMKKQLMAMQ